MTKIFRLTTMAAVCGLLLASCDKPTVTAKIEGLEDGMVLVRTTTIAEDAEPETDEDRIQSTGGRFSIDKEISTLTQMSISPETLTIKDPYGRSGSPQAATISLILIPGEKVSITGSMDDKSLTYSVRGSKINDEYAGFMSQNRETNIVTDSLNRLLESESGKARYAEQEARMQELLAEREAGYDKMDHARTAYIAANPSSEFSTLLTLELPANMIVESYGKLDQHAVEKSRVGSVLKSQVHYATLWLESHAAKNIKPGNKAPDFTLTDAAGIDFTLSSISDKYIVLDFWASWCGFCLSGFPKMKQYYAKYKDRVEFVGIACNSTMEAWHKVLDTYSPGWIQVKDDQNDTAVRQFEIEAFPTKMILDKEHNIIEVFIGEVPDFYPKLDELLR